MQKATRKKIKFSFCFKILFSFMCLSVRVYGQVLMIARKGTGSLGAGVADSCELPKAGQDPSSSPLLCFSYWHLDQWSSTFLML